MKKVSVITIALITFFFLGFSFNKIIQTNKKNQMKKVTGIGGIFFKCKDPNKMKDWYNLHLGLNTNEYGATFEWQDENDSTKKGTTQWSPFAESTKYFEPSSKDFMINYRVADLVSLVDQLKKRRCIYSRSNRNL